MGSILSRDEVELLSAYELEQSGIRQQLVGALYWNCKQVLERYSKFQQDLSPGGRFETLLVQFISDSSQSISQEEIVTLISAMQTIVSVMECIESKAPGMFGIPVSE
jgi:hypothetical protein